MAAWKEVAGLDRLTAEMAAELTVEMLPEGLQKQIAETIGVDKLLLLSELLGGTTLYWPQLDTVLRPVRERRIKQEFNGYNYDALATKYGISAKWVRQLCGAPYAEGQLTIFDPAAGE